MKRKRGEIARSSSFFFAPLKSSKDDCLLSKMSAIWFEGQDGT